MEEERHFIIANTIILTVPIPTAKVAVPTAACRQRAATFAAAAALKVASLKRTGLRLLKRKTLPITATGKFETTRSEQNENDTNLKICPTLVGTNQTYSGML